MNAQEINRLDHEIQRFLNLPAGWQANVDAGTINAMRNAVEREEMVTLHHMGYVVRK